MVAAPAVVGAVAVGGDRAAEVRCGEERHVVAQVDAADVRERAVEVAIACERRASRSAWLAFWVSWVSKPPIETKKICRLAPSALRAPMTRATVCSCCARPLLALLPVDGWKYVRRRRDRRGDERALERRLRVDRAVDDRAVLLREQVLVAGGDDRAQRRRCRGRAEQRAGDAADRRRAVAADLVLEGRLRRPRRRHCPRPRCW